MRLPRLTVFLCLAFAAFGAPPTTVSGMKFQYTFVVGRPFDSISTEVLLNSDGTYSGLRLFDRREMSVAGGTSGGTLASVLTDISIPQNGTWSYRVVDQATSEIVINSSTFVLHFTGGDLAGRLGDPRPNSFNHSFLFSPYDAATRLVNASTRSYVAPGRRVSLGFVISSGERRVLVRAIGPGLRTFGVAEPLEQLRMGVFRSGSLLAVDLGLPATSRATLEIAAQRAGAFPLPTAGDIGQYLTLREGAYTVEVFSANRESSGEVLLEVYQLP